MLDQSSQRRLIEPVPICPLIRHIWPVASSLPQGEFPRLGPGQPALPSSLGTAQSGRRPWFLSEYSDIPSNPASIHGPENLRGKGRTGRACVESRWPIPQLVGRRQACHGPLLPSKQPRHRKLLTLRLLDRRSQRRQFDSSSPAARLLIRHIWPVASPPSQASRTWPGHDRKQTRNKGRVKTSVRSPHHVRVHKRP